MSELIEIIVSDFTFFQNEDVCCIAGINPLNFQTIRPIPYLTREYCSVQKIFPRAKIRGKFELIDAVPPHIEDRHYSDIHKSGLCKEADFYSILEGSLKSSIQSGFNVNLSPGQKYIDFNTPPNKSIITVKIAPDEIRIRQDQFRSERIRGTFVDNDGDKYSFIPITDLCLAQYAFDNGIEKTVRDFNDIIKSSENIYVRIGLTRRYKDPNGRDGYWIQINGIYTFPELFDY